MDINAQPAQGNNFLRIADSNHHLQANERVLCSPADISNWSDNSDIVIPEQPATKIYENPRGQIEIRQPGQFDDEDNVVLFSIETLPTLIDRLKQFIRPSVIDTAIEGSN